MRKLTSSKMRHSNMLFELEWSNYPRAQFFKDRYLSLQPRFKNVIATLPLGFYDDNLMKDLDAFYKDLKKTPKVLMIGDVIISQQKLVMVETSEKTTTHPPDTTQDIEGTVDNCIVKNRVEVNENASERMISMSDEETNSFNEKTAKKSTTYVFEHDIELDMHEFREEIRSQTLVSPKHNELASHISYIFERRIVYRLVKIFSHLKQFMVTHRHYDFASVDIVTTTDVEKSIENILYDSYKLTDVVDQVRNEKPFEESELHNGSNAFEQKVMEHLCQSIASTAVKLFATKYNLPESTCYKLLTAAQFEENLASSLSVHTKRTLIQTCMNNVEKWKGMKNGERKCVYADKTPFVETVQDIKKDINVEFQKTEIILSRMERVVTIMRKMAFEIKGVLSQTKLIDFGDEMFNYKTIGTDVKNELLRVKGVFSVATVFGELEVCIKRETFDDASNEVKTILKQHSFCYSYKLVRKTSDLKLFIRAESFFEAGDKLEVGAEKRIGTLGCCLPGSDNDLYGITCAHVVENSDGEVKVSHKSRETPCDFGSVKGNAFVTQSLANTSIRTIDIAAISIQDHCKNHCRCDLFEGKMACKPVMYADNNCDENLVGTTVYKYGAITGFTEGIISAADHLFENENANKELINIGPLPKVEDISERDSGMYDSSNEYHSEGQDNYLTTGASNVSENTKHSSACDSLLEESIETVKPVENDNVGTDNNDVQHQDDELSREPNVRNSEIIGKGGKESKSKPLKKNKFAEEGDSGAFVCTTDVQTNSILVVSMISAGGSLNDNPVCISIPIGDQLHALVKHMARNKPGFHFLLKQ
ncbi:hypothetical protein ACF0H5_006323 [Mactra antiquata]